jgi:cobalt/nickel transport system permease protein
MTRAFDAFPVFDSPFQSLDPRWKLAALVPAALACATLQTLPAAAAALAGVLLLAAVARLPPAWFAARLAAVGVLLAIFVALLPFVLHGDGPSWQVGPLRFSAHGLHVAALLCLKALAVVSLMMILLATSALDALLKAAHALHVPGLLVQLLVLTYRYAFVLASELARIRVALRVRGYRNRANRHSYRIVGHVAGTLLVRGYERAERVGQAMRCRGFDGRFRSLAQFHTTVPDVLFFLLVLGCAGGLVAWDFAQQRGTAGGF